jgi:hypothetical protein
MAPKLVFGAPVLLGGGSRGFRRGGIFTAWIIDFGAPYRAVIASVAKQSRFPRKSRAEKIALSLRSSQ